MDEPETERPAPKRPAARRKSGRRWILLGAAAALILLLAFALRPEAVKVDLAAVTQGPMSASVQDRGQTRVLDRYVLSSPVSGTLERIPFQAGESVREGEVVARIAPSKLSAVGGAQARAAVAQAEAAVRAARASAGSARARTALAAKEYDRQSALKAQGIASSQDLDKARANHDAAVRDLDAARAAVTQANANLASARAALLALHPGGAGIIEIRAPVGSRIFAVPERSGRAVAPGDPILTLGNPREIEAVIDLLSEDAVKTAVGDRVQLLDWGGDRPVPGIVKTVEASAFTKISALGIEEQRVHVIVSIPDPPPSLGDAYRVQGRIIVWSSPEVVQIPIGALTRFGARWGTYVADKGRARKRDLEIGHRNDETAEVLSGVRAGDRVIVNPTDEISNGVRVSAD